MASPHALVDIVRANGDSEGYIFWGDCLTTPKQSAEEFLREDGWTPSTLDGSKWINDNLGDEASLEEHES